MNDDDYDDDFMRGESAETNDDGGSEYREPVD